MDAMQFEKHAKADPELYALLHAVSEDVAPQITVDESQQSYTTGVDILVGVAAYAMYRWIKDTLDNRRALLETGVAAEQAELIVKLKADGFPPKQAEAIATSLLKHIADRTKDDPMLKKVQDLLGSGK